MASRAHDKPVRTLLTVFPDQLTTGVRAFRALDPRRDAIWMSEDDALEPGLWQHKKRLVLLLSAMRHFRNHLQDKGYRVIYSELSVGDTKKPGSEAAAGLRTAVRRLVPQAVAATRPGSFRTLEMVRAISRESGIRFDLHEDDSFYRTPETFSQWIEKHRHPMLEFFYRRLRSEYGILIDTNGNPVGGAWDYDKSNRASFSRGGPPATAPPRRFSPDGITRKVIALVQSRFPDYPGRVDGFDLPVTEDEARLLLDDFIKIRLGGFGTWEDAMWTGRPFLFHSRLSTSLNLKLIAPSRCVDAAVAALGRDKAPLNSVEGFVRQVLGWRELVHAVYWFYMPDYAKKNGLHCDDLDVPRAYWNGLTSMRCIAETMRMILDHGYAHHIHRLMVMGNFALLLGVHPLRFHRWHLCLYCDAFDWVSLPNALGMSQYGDDGIMGTKPYVASGSYINRMSDFCGQCRYRYRGAAGPDACPITTLYWDFLIRHANQFRRLARMALQYRNLDRKSKDEVRSIRARADMVKRMRDEL